MMVWKILNFVCVCVCVCVRRACVCVCVCVCLLLRMFLWRLTKFTLHCDASKDPGEAKFDKEDPQLTYVRSRQKNQIVTILTSQLKLVTWSFMPKAIIRWDVFCSSDDCHGHETSSTEQSNGVSFCSRFAFCCWVDLLLVEGLSLLPGELLWWKREISSLILIDCAYVSVRVQKIWHNFDLQSWHFSFMMMHTRLWGGDIVNWAWDRAQTGLSFFCVCSILPSV